MIPEILVRILDMMGDLIHEDDLRIVPSIDLDLIPTPLWEGFVHDIREEFEVPELVVDPEWTARELYEQIVLWQAKNSIELPEFTLVIHADDKIVNDLLDDLEAVLEKHNMPYAMTAYVPKNGTMEKQPLSRASDEAVFNYHEKVMDMFRGK